MTELLAMVFAAALSAGNAEVDRTAAEGAAKIAMARLSPPRRRNASRYT